LATCVSGMAPRIMACAWTHGRLRRPPRPPRPRSIPERACASRCRCSLSVTRSRRASRWWSLSPLHPATRPHQQATHEPAWRHGGPSAARPPSGGHSSGGVSRPAPGPSRQPGGLGLLPARLSLSDRRATLGPTPARRISLPSLSALTRGRHTDNHARPGPVSAARGHGLVGTLEVPSAPLRPTWSRR